jgi:copper chaperone CopZ
LKLKEKVPLKPDSRARLEPLTSVCRDQGKQKQFQLKPRREANYSKKNVTVVFNPKQITLEQIKKAIDKIGYKAK